MRYWNACEPSFSQSSAQFRPFYAWQCVSAPRKNLVWKGGFRIGSSINSRQLWRLSWVCEVIFGDFNVSVTPRYSVSKVFFISIELTMSIFRGWKFFIKFPSICGRFQKRLFTPFHKTSFSLKQSGMEVRDWPLYLDMLRNKYGKINHLKENLTDLVHSFSLSLLFLCSYSMLILKIKNIFEKRNTPRTREAKCKKRMKSL